LNLVCEDASLKINNNNKCVAVTRPAVTYYSKKEGADSLEANLYPADGSNWKLWNATLDLANENAALEVEEEVAS